MFIEIYLLMGEYIDVALQSTALPFTIILSSIFLGIYALFGVDTENDDPTSVYVA